MAVVKNTPPGLGYIVTVTLVIFALLVANIALYRVIRSPRSVDTISSIETIPVIQSKNVIIDSDSVLRTLVFENPVSGPGISSSGSLAGQTSGFKTIDITNV